MFGSKGKIDISVQRISYAPGDVIRGSVALTLKKPVKARELSISLIGQYGTTQTTPRVELCPFGKMGEVTQYNDFKTTAKTVHIGAFRQLLDGESEYGREREYPFEIKIQADISTSPIVKWYLLAKLDIPGGLDISKEVGITIE
jgi:hypothetical protein